MMVRGLVLIVALLGLAILVRYSGDPHAVDLSQRLQPASINHVLGTDHLGRDLATRLLHGSLPSLRAIVIVVVSSLALGLLAGSAIALAPRPIGASLRWLAETTLALPTLIIALVLSAMMGAGEWTVAITLLATCWAPYALTIAALLRRLQGEPYFQASMALGSSMPAALRRHLVPNALPVIRSLIGADAGRAVILVASLGFIGLAADTGKPEWGAMIYEYRAFLFSHPRLILAPLMACALVTWLIHFAFDKGEP